MFLASCWRCRRGSAGSRTVLALVAGFVLGLLAVFKVLDMGFLAGAQPAVRPAVDWRYAGSLVELLRDSFGDGPGTVLLVVAGLLGVALLVLLPLAVLRLTRLAARHRRPACADRWPRSPSLWLVLALLDVRGDARRRSRPATPPATSTAR